MTTSNNSKAKLSKVAIAIKNAPDLKVIYGHIQSIKIHAKGLNIVNNENVVRVVCIEILKRFELSVKFKGEQNLTDKEKNVLDGLGDLTPLNTLLKALRANFLDYAKVIQWFRIQTGDGVIENLQLNQVAKYHDYTIEELTKEVIDSLPHPLGELQEIMLLQAPVSLPPSTKNYITPNGWANLKAELSQLVNHERPQLTQVINWAAGNGDRSENGDYIYGKRRLREIDKRIRFLTKRLEIAEVVDPETRPPTDVVYFGATVVIERGNGTEQTLSIVGVDEIDLSKGRISWIAPIARALLKARVGDGVIFHGAEGLEDIEILSVSYQKIE
jgi:transcription elongation factor GreB